MNIISLIIRREYSTRVRKKSFIVMTILGPILMAALFIVPIWLTQNSDTKKVIGVVDEYNTEFTEGLFYKRLKETDNLKFDYLTTDILTAKDSFANSGYYAILYLPQSVIRNPRNVALYSNKQVSLNVKMYLENEVKTQLERLKMNQSISEELEKLGIDEDKLQSKNNNDSEIQSIAENIRQSIKTDVQIRTIKLQDNGIEESSSSEIITILSFIGGFMIYIFIFLFGSQVMRGVIEEKTSRIIEVIISSVKPFQLMMGKIIGIAMVGLTQFLLWVIFTLMIVKGFQVAYPEKFNFNRTDQIIAASEASIQTTQNLDQVKEVNDLLLAIGSIDFVVMIFTFIFYFLGGYLFYAAIYAAVGAAVDSETDTQQFMLPITIPMVLSITMIQFVIYNPQGPIAYWLSIIPFTSPVIMMARIPFGVPIFSDGFDLPISMLMLILGIWFNTWMAAKIYRTGILMYGKKASYSELWKWMWYKN